MRRNTRRRTKYVGLYSATFPYALYNTYGSLPANAASSNWDNVNYLLNHKGSASVAAVQEAIWFFLSGQYHVNPFIPSVPPPGAAALVADALANGNGFIPAAGQAKSITNRCTNIIGNGSTFGQCRSCRLGGLGGAKQ